jgi:hypothetical protein
MAPSEATDAQTMANHAADPLKHSEAFPNAFCGACGGQFKPIRRHHRFCRPSCRRAAFERRRDRREAQRVQLGVAWQLFE